MWMSCHTCVYKLVIEWKYKLLNENKVFEWKQVFAWRLHFWMKLKPLNENEIFEWNCWNW